MGREVTVYIAGPITGVDNYRERFKVYESRLHRKGCRVLNPAILPQGRTNAEYMRVCLGLIDCADIVLFTDGWEKSAGARCEFKYCQYIGKRYAFKIEEIEEVTNL